MDVAPGGQEGDEKTTGRAQRARLLAYARRAEGLMGPKHDAKLRKAMRLVREFVDEGYAPILFCRFIPTAEYVAQELRKALPKNVEVAAVTGKLPPAYFHLYGVERDDVDYVMETFPIVRCKDQKAHGEYRTKRVILEIHDEMVPAMATGEPYRIRLDPPPADPRVAHSWDTKPEWVEQGPRRAVDESQSVQTRDAETVRPLPQQVLRWKRSPV